MLQEHLAAPVSAGGLELNIVDYLVALRGGDDEKDVRMSAPALVEAMLETWG